MLNGEKEWSRERAIAQARHQTIMMLLAVVVEHPLLPRCDCYCRTGCVIAVLLHETHKCTITA